jgi:cytochrome bd ubiquinol oxidase subunit II
VWDASSSRLTLFVMLVSTLLILPVVLIYTGIVYRALRGPVTPQQVESGSTHLY